MEILFKKKKQLNITIARWYIFRLFKAEIDCISSIGGYISLN